MVVVVVVVRIVVDGVVRVVFIGRRKPIEKPISWRASTAKIKRANAQRSFMLERARFPQTALCK